MEPILPDEAGPSRIHVGSRVRILERTEHNGRTGIVIEAERDREVANVLVDGSDTTTEVDYVDLELLD